MLLTTASDIVESSSSNKISFPYYDLLDGLRGFAIIAILYAHSSLPSIILNKLHLGSGGFIGVDIFFVLSSFLITSLLLKEYINHDKISIKNFYTRRFLRLLPPVLVALAIFVPIISIINWKIAIKDIIYTLTYTTNILMSLQAFISPKLLPGYFYHTWSLATEEQFYLIFPVAFLYVINKKIKFFSNSFYTLLIVIAFFAIAPVLKPLLKDGIYSFPLWRIGEFFVGFLTSLVYANVVWKEALLEKARFLVAPPELLERIVIPIHSSALTLCSFAVFFTFVFFAHVTSWFVVSVGHLLLSIIAALLILQITVLPNRVIRYFLGSKTMVWIGLISYGLYIYHLPIMLIETWFFKEKLLISELFSFPYPLNTGVAIIIKDSLYLLLSFLIASVSYRFMEKPIMEYKAKFSKV